MGVADIAGVLVIAITLSIIAIVGYALITAFIDTGMFDVTFLTQVQEGLKAFDYAIVVGVFGLSIASILLAFTVRSHPAFFFASLIILLMIVAISATFSNIYYQFVTSNATITAAANNFPMLLMLFQQLPLIAIAMSAIIAVAMHAKTSVAGTNY